MSETRIRLFASDIDGTLLGEPESQAIFLRGWSQLDPADRPLLCYNTGRLLDDAKRLVREGELPLPDYIIAGVGTTIYAYRQGRVLKAFAEILDEGWDQQQVEEVVGGLDMPITRQPHYVQHAYKSSWYLDDATPEQIDQIEKALEEAGLEAAVVYSSNRYVDILPKWANKGNALQWLIKHLEIPPEQVLVAGDMGSDTAMFQIPGVKGIVVGNAQPELYQATKHLPIYHADTERQFAAAVIDGLIDYGLFPEDIDRRPPEKFDQALQESVQRSDHEAPTALEDEQLELIREGYEQAIQALKRNITPLGFTAASLEDNESIGTDVNYRSIWARDGCVTIVGSLPLGGKHEDIRQCQANTLETLLEGISPNGQIPANVSVEDKTPDYSGVGGIAAIDAGLWVIIAFYEYIRVSQRLDFLRRHSVDLQRVMDWLAAHDSNNDALLEIPEAGDWTDLFGRSYNVLYDEVLWYRANICYGRLLELLGEERRAGDYLRWSRVIKREILANFWPTTEHHIYQSISFAEQQFSLGDARYLLAQITPFDFSWRCDCYANVLAYLYDVIDDRKASQAFRFMWGAGVAEPYPIANLYPVVTAGDRDWREYYTVNLLNLPHHYHNGGIWPFVGGAWVRFVDKLGLRDLALQELYKLAQLNKLGVLHEWEFNEWAHGKTGRPMGKAYQAWSASEFILACHSLGLFG